MSDAVKKLENYKLMMKDGLAPDELEHLLSARSSAKCQSFSAQYTPSHCSPSLFLLTAVLFFFCSLHS